MCLFHIKGHSIIHETVETHCFRCHNCNHKAGKGGGGGKINFSKTHRFWCAAVALRMDTFKILKTQSERYAIEMLFKVQVRPDHPTSNTN